MSDETTRPEAWEIHIERTGADERVYVEVPRGDWVQFEDPDEAVAFARTPIDRWERDRAVELLRDLLAADEGYEVWSPTREFLTEIEGGRHG